MQVKSCAVAGTFYPGEASQLTQEVQRYLGSALPFSGALKAVIVPHAGYRYSGPIAGSAYAPLQPARATIKRVVLLGPSHHVGFQGLALSGADLLLTPLGTIPVDRAWGERLAGLPGVQVNDAAFAREHSLEVQLPFLQCVLDRFSVLPILVGAAAPELVERALELLWGGPETAIVVSSDLSHYYDYAAAGRLDTGASQAIETLRPDRLGEEQACGRHAIRGLLRRARALDLRATTIDLRNSGDTAGPKDRVVGYGAYAFESAGTARLSESERTALLRCAEAAIRFRLAHGKVPAVQATGLPQSLSAMRASFVTLELDGRLRGCIGSVEPVRRLIDDVVHNACRAAVEDPRFPPLTEAEIGRLDISVSILGAQRPIAFGSEPELIGSLNPDVDGVILQDGGRRGLFLPQVWATLPAPPDFVRHLKMKAGLPSDHWSDKLRAWRFSVEGFGETLSALGERPGPRVSFGA